MAENGKGNGAGAPRTNGRAYPFNDHTYDVVVVGSRRSGAVVPAVFSHRIRLPGSA